MSEPSPGGPARKPSGFNAIVIAGVVVTLIAASLWYWRSARQSQGGWAGGGPIDVVATTLHAQAAPVSLEGLGELRAVRQVMLSAEVAGRVAAISFEPGQRVKAGMVLVQLDDATEQADLAAAKASAGFAQGQFTRASELARTGATSREMLQQRQAERDQTAAQVQQLEARIRQKRIRAPFDGELGLRRIDLGQYLNPGDVAVTLTDSSQLYANFDIPQQELARVTVGQTVQVRIDTAGVAPVQATISAIEPQVGRDTRNASIQAKVDNQGRTLQPGMYATVDVMLPAEPDALTLPVSAVMTSASGDAAAVVRGLTPEKAGKAEIVPITVGRRIGDTVVIARGLKAGDIVITEGQLRVRPGADLRVVDKPVAEGAPATGGQP
ncbi:efflux RND transporter periplasmic adaptor subunit [Pectobacterium polaris]|uniref:Efflux RND transporter periplasmic adaptor subunit n=1 Tax=Pectobacterium polaris TaxID=2042057 RepID=A0AAW5GCP2_9GAMM|nr:efflux RND transporter periplasmic adaptor subunit [Pectobacterium polaris]MCL6351478.1 efflux RND transporter periplasmic adaptor subunit [Pectobacterium polaris]MCL6368494.1 efflux RND transporter periplasmic adaptor subunit [Pectobacterium polaris]